MYNRYKSTRIMKSIGKETHLTSLLRCPNNKLNIYNNLYWGMTKL